MSRQSLLSWLFAPLDHRNRVNGPSPWKRSSYTRRLQVETLEDRRMLAVFSVTNLNDLGAGSLRDAITSANATAALDEINFSVNGVINIASQLPTITNPLTINGPGPDLLTIDAGNGLDGEFSTGDGWRIFLMFDGNTASEFDVTLNGLTLTGGDTPNGNDDSPLINGQAGGAIGTLENLTVIDSVITGNATGDGGNSSAPFGIGGSGGQGAGIFAGYGDLNILSSIISGNKTGTNGTGGIQDGRGGSGGGIDAASITVTVIDSIISGNQTEGPSAHGGGISNAYGDTIISGSTISGNSTSGDFSSGGGISHRFGNLEITGSTIENNIAQGNGAGGGGIFARINAEHGVAEISHSTISGNSVTQDEGGGILNWSASMTISSSTITGNTAPPENGSGVYSLGVTVSAVNFENSIIAGNANEDLAASSNISHPFVSMGYNLVGTAAGPGFILADFNQTGDLTGVLDPLLGPLAENGGPTRTHALLPGSAALNAGASSESTDQRGSARNDGNGVDIGAYEAQSAPSADFVDNDFIDGVDFLAWQLGFGMTSGATRADGNSDDDGDVDTSDFSAWEATFGQPEATPLAAAVDAAEEIVSDEALPVDRAELIDAAIAFVGLQSRRHNDDSPVVDEEMLLPLIAEHVATNKSIPPTNSAVEAEIPGTGSDGEEADNLSWLSDNLLESIFAA